MSPGRWLPSFAVGLVVTGLVYHGVVTGWFLGDDFGGLALLGGLPARELPVLFRMFEGQGYWRPLWGVLFWAVHAMCGANATAFHVVALLLHASCGAVLARLVARGTGSPGAGLAAAVLFLVHPVHGPSLGWIASIQEPLFTLGSLLAILWAQRWLEEPRARWLGLALLALLAALASKEPAVACAPVVVLAALLARGASARARLVLALAFVAITGVYGAARVATHSLPGYAGGLAVLAERSVPMTFDACGQLLLFPGAGPAAALLVTVLAVLAVVWQHRSPASVSAGWLWLSGIAFLAPQAFAYDGFDVNDTRLLYAPSAFFVAALASAGARACERARVHPIAVRAVVVVLAAGAWWILAARLQPFIAAGQLSLRYRDELLRVVPADALPRDGQTLHFVTNEVPMPAGTRAEDMRYFWPVLDQTGLCVLYHLPLPPREQMLGLVGPDFLAQVKASLDRTVSVTFLGERGRERAAFVTMVRDLAKGNPRDPHVIVVFWDRDRRQIERIDPF